MEIEDIKNSVETIKGLVEQAQGERLAYDDGSPYVIVPDGYRVESLEKLCMWPTRKKGKPSFTRAASFCSYVNQQKSQHSRLYVMSAVCLVAILDHHAEALAGWGEHKAELILTKTPEWELWNKNNNVPKNQRDFAQFIEDNAEDIVSPTGNELLDLVRTIKLSSNLDCTGEVAEDGNQKSQGFVLTTRTKAGSKGADIELPNEFTVGLAPYEGGPHIAIKARLRLEVCAPKFSLRYELVKVQQVEKKALEDIVAEVANATKMEAWYGTP